jgi:hypothetical protein
MDAAGTITEQAQFLPRLLAPEAADAFLRLLWRDAISDPAISQTHHDGILFKNALEIHGRNYPPLLALHWGLTSYVAERTGQDLLPSFAYFRLYFAGDLCRVHADRPACELSVSLALGTSDEHDWPLSLESAPADDTNGVAEDFGGSPFTSFSMRPGDGLLYRGSKYRHGRIEPNPNRWSAHAFLHWVTRGGPHEAEAFERLDLISTPDPSGSD